MLSLTRFLQQQAEAQDDGDCDGQVEQLVQRVSEAVLIGDRREALQHLKDLLANSAKAQLAFGAVGFPAMLQVVREREDLEMMQLALESLAAAVGGDAGGGTGGQAAAINAQQLVRTPEGLPLLLSLLDQEPVGMGDFYARYHTLQVLKGLAATAPRQLQEAILGAPLGVTRLMGLLSEDQEVLRNEALLLLTQLAGGSGDLQKLAVFEGAFERLFVIIREEGGLDGDIVVQDCFQLIAALLRGSPSNQLMFRETGFLAQLPPLLRLPEHGEGSAKGGGGGRGGQNDGGGGIEEELPPGMAANLVAALEVVLALLPPPAAAPGAAICASQAENRQALLQRGLLDVLVGLALRGGGAPHTSVRAQALLCLAALVGGSRTQQDQLAALSVQSTSGETLPLLQAVLQAAVSADSRAEQVAADHLLEAYCCGNSAGQAVLAGSLLHSAAAAPGSFGGYLLLSLGRQGSLPELAASSRAAAALSHLISGNPGIQPHLLALQVRQQQQQQKAATGSSGGSLMSLCASHLGLLATQHGRQPGSVQAVADTLRLLLLWLHACPPAVTAFLRAVAQSQPFLVDSIRGSNACSSSASSAHPLTRGMLALLLGLCATYAEDAAGTPTQQQLLDAIGSQIGHQQYVGILDAMLHHVAAGNGSGSSSAGSSGGGDSSSGGPAEGPIATPAFATFVSTLVAEVRQRVTGSPGPPLPPPAAQQQYQPAGQAPLPTPSFAAPAAAAAAPAALNGKSGSSSSPAPWPAPQAPAAAPGATSLTALQPTPARVTASPWQLPAGASQQSVGTVAPAAAGAAAASSYGAPQAPLASHGSGAGELRQALATVEALQRENQHLRAEHAALAERLRLSGGGGANSSAHMQQSPALAAEAAAARQAAAAATQQLREIEAEARRAREDVQAAQAGSRKLERDLEDLSAAYGTLDAHAGSLQQQVEQLQQELTAERRRQQQQQQAEASASGGSGDGGGGGVSEAEVQRRVEAARQVAEAKVQLRVEAARQVAEEESDDAMGDLLVCLGQEEAKVARLRERLEAQGVDCEALLADIVAAAEGGVDDLT